MEENVALMSAPARTRRDARFPSQPKYGTDHKLLRHRLQRLDNEVFLFKQMVLLSIDVRWLAVRPMRNKWASCSTNGHLHFNVELLTLEDRLWDYVIVHELLHFEVPNHGKLWKSLMRAHLGDYENHEIELKRHGR